MNRSPLDLMDPFWGNGEIDLPRPEGIAATWGFLKAQCGNTHPGACRPFGMVSACAYSGGYPTGYGTHRHNCNGTVPRLHSSPVVSGFTHFQQSGTGAIMYYYNYVRVSPYTGDWREATELRPLEEEQASPGYYSCRIGGTGIRAELTVSARAAHHRYAFPAATQAGIVVDFSSGGLFGDRTNRPERAALRVVAPGHIVGNVVMHGVPICVDCRCRGGGAPFLFVGNERTDDATLALDGDPGAPLGAVLPVAANAAQTVEVQVAFSFQSIENAGDHAAAAQAAGGFELHRRNAAAAWSSAADRVSVEINDPTVSTIFHSALYHSLVKPTDCTGEDPFGGDGPCFFDFATLWDQYKTLLPLILSCYPDVGRPMVQSLLTHSRREGHFLNCVLLLTSQCRHFDMQARGLLHCTLLDTLHLGYDLPWTEILDQMLADLEAEGNRSFFAHGSVRPVTHTLDLAVACHCTAVLADRLNRRDLVERYSHHAGNWRNIYDPATGRLIEAEYYEGGLWNYSFRLLPDMAERVDLYPDRASFVADLDRFFGYGQPPVRQQGDPSDAAALTALFELNRFEGYNNEPDMEAPYAYIYGGRPDRTAEVVRAGMRYMFTTGRGGAPGNIDSGGLSSCYVWNALGLFPVTGQPLMLIGSPLVRSAELRLAGSTFRIEVKNPEDGIYVRSARLNGRSIDRAWLTSAEFAAGGTLELTLGATPSDWGTRELPPTHARRADSF